MNNFEKQINELIETVASVEHKFDLVQPDFVNLTEKAFIAWVLIFFKSTYRSLDMLRYSYAKPHYKDGILE